MKKFSCHAAVALLVVIVAISAGPVRADKHSPQECREGGEFIRNAALSRDGGMLREAFMQKIAEDLMMIRGYAIDMRWFARDEADEKLLTAHAQHVFDEPNAPAVHEATFIEGCMRTE